MEQKKILTKSWNSRLQNQLQKLKKKLNNKSLTIAILGIGSDINGDDAAGPLFADLLAERFKGNPSIVVFNCGKVPENFSGPVKKFHPDYLLIVDAGLFNEKRASIGFFDWQNIDGMDISTHSLPVSIFIQYLINEINCEVGVLLIQSGNTAFASDISEDVVASVLEASNSLTNILSEFL